MTGCRRGTCPALPTGRPAAARHRSRAYEPEDGFAGGLAARVREALAHRRGPGTVAPLGHAVGDLEILGRIVAGGADPLGHGGKPVLIPGNLLRQVRNDHDALVLDPHRAAGLPLSGPLGRGGGLVALCNAGLEPVAQPLHAGCLGERRRLQIQQHLGRQRRDVAEGEAFQIVEMRGIIGVRHGGVSVGREWQGHHAARSSRSSAESEAAALGLGRATAM